MTSPTPRVLIVDDEPDTLDLLRAATRHMPYEAVFAASGIDALIQIFEAYRDGRPFSVMVLDCALPLVDGFTIAKAVRLMEKSEITSQHARIGFFTAYPEDVERSTLLQEVGAEAYWRKPEDAAELPKVIASWLKLEVPKRQ
jgi:two-component system sensor histidine kinase/response regulator